ncbi:MAG: MFS transporter [Rickettsiales bacterium]|nr:MFS transporter [Rickettsiales bacterium]
MSVFIFASAIGINAVTFPAILNKNSVDAAHVGIVFMLDSFGGILMSFFLSRLIKQLNILRALMISSCCYALIILLIYFYQNLYLWGVFAFLMGNLWFIYVITRQSWLNILLKDKQRGVATGIFSMLISAGVALGPVIVSFSGAENYLSFVISAVLTLTSFSVLLLAKTTANPRLESERISLTEFFKTNPRIFLSRFFLDFQTCSLVFFSVIFGIKIGLSYELAGLLISAYMASGFFDVVVGFLLKKFNPYQLINLGFIGCLCCFLLIIFIHNYQFLLSAYFFFGIFIACIFVSSFKVCNEDFKSKKLVAANATFQLIGSIGAICGSLTSGILLNIFSAVGFPISIVLSCIFYLSFLVIYEKTKNFKSKS